MFPLADFQQVLLYLRKKNDCLATGKFRDLRKLLLEASFHSEANIKATSDLQIGKAEMKTIQLYHCPQIG